MQVWAARALLRASFRPVDRPPEADALIVSTGGTTGKPKGVRLSHRAVASFLEHVSQTARGLGARTLLADTPQQALYALRLGLTAVLAGRKSGRPERALELMRSATVDAYFGSPFLWTEMMRLPGARQTRLPASLRAVLLGGAPVTREFLERLGQWLHPSTEVRVVYGMTEAGPVTTASAKEKLAWRGVGDLVGEPLSNIRLEISASSSDGGEPGEVVVHAESLCTGYVGQPVLCPTDGLRTGDSSGGSCR